MSQWPSPLPASIRRPAARSRAVHLVSTCAETTGIDFYTTEYGHEVMRSKVLIEYEWEEELLLLYTYALRSIWQSSFLLQCASLWATHDFSSPSKLASFEFRKFPWMLHNCLPIIALRTTLSALNAYGIRKYRCLFEKDVCITVKTRQFRANSLYLHVYRPTLPWKWAANAFDRLKNAGKEG